MFLLDTNILSVLIRDPQAQALLNCIARAGEENIATSVIVAGELRYGAAKKQSTRLIDRVEAILGRLEIVPFTPPMDRTYGEIRASLERRGQLIGANDLLIAAQVVHLSAELVTDNTREFLRVDGLRVVNWLHAPE
jgi:tRNA(fMet)-specific endonuclease VapC